MTWPSRDLVADADVVAGGVVVDRGDAATAEHAVVDDEPVAVDAAAVGRHDLAGGGRAQRGAAAAAEVDAVVQALVAVDRVGAVAEGRGDVAVDRVGQQPRARRRLRRACDRALAAARWRRSAARARLRSISSICSCSR